MFWNFFKITCRNFLKNRLYSSINIIGLSLGLSCAMLITLYTVHESNFDTFNSEADKIFQVRGKIKPANETIIVPSVSYITAPYTVKNNFGVKSFLRLYNPQQKIILSSSLNKDFKFTESGFLFSDSNFFNFFSFTLLKGDRNKVLQNPFSVVITPGAAKRYFGNSNPIGQTIRYNNQYDFIVTGVMNKAPSNSSIQFDFLASLSSLDIIEKELIQYQSQLVQMGSFTTFLLLNNSSTAPMIEKNLDKIANEGITGSQNKQSFFLLPLRELHAVSHLAERKYISVFRLIAFAILVLAILNYLSLSTAQAPNRAKEIGIRKAIGSSRNKIRIQFFFESFFYSSISFLLGYIICTLIQPVFFNFFQIDVDNGFLRSPKILFIYFILFLVTVFFSSTYPAIIFSNFRPAAVLYGKSIRQFGGISIRKIFTTIQFVACITIIICGSLIHRQLDFFKDTDTGIRKENCMVIPFDAQIGKRIGPLKHAIQSHSAISRTAIATFSLYKGYESYFVKPKNSSNDVAITVMNVDESFIPLLDLKWKYPPSDSISYLNREDVILNKTAMEELNIKAKDVNAKIELGQNSYRISGVVQDFNFESLEKRIGPLCLRVFKSEDSLADWAFAGGYLYAQIKPSVNLSSAINELKNIYQKFDTEKKFEYYFLNDSYDEMYRSEDKLSKLSNAFVFLILLISALGLLGLSAFMAQQRVKEISIRKIMGAGNHTVFSLLTKDILKTILVSFLIACPIAWWMMHKWLQSFAYRIQITIDVFIVSGIIAFAIAVLVSYSQVVKLVFINPVKGLRTE